MPRGTRRASRFRAQHQATSCDGCQLAWCANRSAAWNGIRRRLRLPSVFRTVARGRRGGGGAATAAGPIDRRVPRCPGQRRAAAADRRGRRVDRRRGRRRVGAGPSQEYRCRAGRASALDRIADDRSGSPGGAALSERTAPRWSGGGDDAHARIQPAVAGRRADPVVGRSMAATARCDGGGGRLRSAHVCRTGAVERAAGGGRRIR